MKNLVLVISSFFIIGGAFAEDPAPTDANHPCREEIKKICPNQARGEGMGQCIQAHKSEFSAACQEKLKEVKDKMHSAMAVCKGDAVKFCKGVRRGRGGIVVCLKSHMNEVSPACKEQLSHTNK